MHGRYATEGVWAFCVWCHVTELGALRSKGVRESFSHCKKKKINEKGYVIFESGATLSGFEKKTNRRKKVWGLL